VDDADVAANPKEGSMVDIATITAAIGAASAGVGLIDKISDQVSRFLTRRETPVMPVEHRAKIEAEGDAIVQRHHGVEYQRITATELQKLPEADLRHIQVLEKSMENHYEVWAAVYPQLALAVDPIAKAKTEQQLHDIVVKMKGDLVGILDFLMRAGLELDDHYRHVRDVVARV
jgi:hypothetical protein